MAASDKLVPSSGVMDISPYVPGKSFVPGEGELIKLSSNETPMGPSPKAVEAYKNEAFQLERYPDGAAAVLREAIGQKHGIDPGRIVCGTGSDDILNLLAKAYLRPGDEAIVTEFAFQVFKIAIMGQGARPVFASEVDYRADVDAILSCVSDATRMVFLANPNNPTGTYLPFSEVERLRAGLPERVLLVLDAAYAEYIDREDYNPGLEMVSSGDNTVMTRTFSKVYGLASLRLGWAYCPQGVADALNRVRGPFNVPGPAIAAGVAALADEDYVERSLAHNNKWLPWLSDKIAETGVKVTPSVGNFVLIHFVDNGKSAQDADRFLQSKRIIVRPLGGFGLPNALRVTVGTEKENLAFVDALSEFMA